jgi:hypothetical protein
MLIHRYSCYTGRFVAMALPRKLTAAEIGGLSQGNYRDQSGVTLRVLPSGTRSWVLAYRSPSSYQPRRVSFGIWPSVTLAEARVLVAKAKVQLSKGIDPQEIKDAASSGFSVAVALDRYNELYLHSLKSGVATFKDLHRILSSKLDRSITSVSKADVLKILNSYRAKGQLVALRRYRGLLIGFFAACVEQEFISDNPASATTLS